MKASWFFWQVLMASVLCLGTLEVSQADTSSTEQLVHISDLVVGTASPSSTPTSVKEKSTSGSSQNSASSQQEKAHSETAAQTPRQTATAPTATSNSTSATEVVNSALAVKVADAAQQPKANQSVQAPAVAQNDSSHENAPAKTATAPSTQTPAPAKKPTLTPTGYVQALIPSLTVARDLGKNCQTALSTNASNQDICDQFDRAVSNLASYQSKIEKTTPRPTDTKSVAPELMDQFNQLSQQLDQEVQYLRAYRATQDDD